MSDEDWRITCGVCGRKELEGGSIGHLVACVSCYAKLDAAHAQSVHLKKTNEQLSKVNDGLRNQNVAQDQAIENDTRVVELRAEVEMLKRENLLLKERVSFLEMQVSQLNELARG